ncbi:NAD-dependent malic enzyme [Weissella paramesenteroides]|uniref:malolactic enzyme n=1 Tax=Weissella paramesenteroides TaxID=1249 RepID=UPI00123B9F8D|nr:malolactic enzyme [Weissella paramesenteroides]KAA8438760.1 NAD-dependent malic enzyme [Weissella paramesenteroides]KAA8440768.1 NAD-dependent malic enzyme [Weissella paramesenteroides]KAA8443199.1 NAD-dependent malic enzyme [Weissella paramesenteroides]KAA8445385.1 NAD-dependent malic enzyme [Weissella paramesenteroides]KAA8448824.1 NAD-dependent malic enzyme [Weissella paramesenteroides]
MRGQEILNNPFLNKGTGFTEEERAELGLTGLLPAHVQTIKEQADQAYAQYLTKANNVEKRIFLSTLFDTNRTLFYYLVDQHVAEFMPIVYDPTIADTIENYSALFVNPQNAAFLDINHPENIEATLKNAADGRDIKLLVATDAEGILGIGDWGVQGVDIAVGKLMVYTAAAGIDPTSVLPVSVDAGTNRKELLADPLYLGNRHERVRGEQYFEFIDKFVKTAQSLFPDMYLHFEDFGRSTATKILNTYKNNWPTFNDDIQGTGIVVTSAVLGALAITGEDIKSQTYLTYGGGSAGTGIASRVLAEFMQQGLSEEEARKHFYMVDRQGLLFDDDETLTPEQKPFARSRSEFENADELTDLLTIVKTVKPTVLVGTSTNPGSFTKEVVAAMIANTDHPKIFPLSNPTKLHEAMPDDLIKWSDGKALVAAGVPVDPVVASNGVTYEIGQANNMLVYPGLGLGTIVAKAKTLSYGMISAAAHALGGMVDTSQPGAPVLPPVSRLSEMSFRVAVAVAKQAIAEGLNQVEIDNVEAAVKSAQWIPKY